MRVVPGPISALVRSGRDRTARILDTAGTSPGDAERVRLLEERVAHLEALVEGLQDAVHRDSVRHEDRMLRLEERLEPEELAKTISEDARRRGL